MLANPPSTFNPQAALLDHALAYARRGWSIIPVVGKKSAGLWKPFQTRAADEKTLRRLFAKKGITGLAVVLGSASGGLAVRDFDDANAYHTWAAENPVDAASLPTVRTARGFHVYGRLDEEAFIIFPDGELRADSKHYVLLPPSVHPDGVVYTWVNPPPDGETPLPSVLSSASQKKKTQADPANAIKHTACATSVIARTQPTGPGQRNRCLFELARQLKGTVPEGGPDKLREIVREWHHQALPRIRTKEFSESWADFIIAWQKVKHPAGCSFRAAANATACEPLPGVATSYDGNLRRLVALCWHLQAQRADRRFPLGCRKAAEYLEVSTVHAWRLLKALEFDGIIRLETKGNKAKGTASEWRFTASIAAFGQEQRRD